MFNVVVWNTADYALDALQMQFSLIVFTQQDLSLLSDNIGTWATYDICLSIEAVRMYNSILVFVFCINITIIHDE